MIPERYAQYEKVVTVACVNYKSIWGDRDANLRKIKDKTIEAASFGGQMIAFPELALSGYECGVEARRDHQPCAMHRHIAETIPGPATEEMTALARQLGIYVLFGMPERDKLNPQIQYNSTVLIGPEGMVGLYRKLHLSPLPIWCEDVCFTPGGEIPVFTTRYGPIGIQICADFWRYPELARIQTLKGARLIFNTAATGAGPGKTDFIVNTTLVRATENYIYTATANMTGEDKTMGYQGHSAIAGPAYPRLMHLYATAGEAEEIICATLSFERLHQWGARHDWQAERRSQLISQELSKYSR